MGSICILPIALTVLFFAFNKKYCNQTIQTKMFSSILSIKVKALGIFKC